MPFVFSACPNAGSESVIVGYRHMQTSTLTPELFRRVLGHFATGITVLTVEKEPGSVYGMTANSFTSVSIDPFLILVCVDHNARFLPMLKLNGRFGVNILRDSQMPLSDHFARGQQGPEADQRLGIAYDFTSSGIPVIRGVLAQLACNISAEYPGGDHTIVLAEVEGVRMDQGDPLLYFRGQYRRLHS